MTILKMSFLKVSVKDTVPTHAAVDETDIR